MCNESGDKQKILDKISYSLSVDLPEILALQFLIWGMFYNSDTLGNGFFRLH